MKTLSKKKMKKIFEGKLFAKKMLKKLKKQIWQKDFEKNIIVRNIEKKKTWKRDKNFEKIELYWIDWIGLNLKQNN